MQNKNKQSFMDLFTAFISIKLMTMLATVALATIIFGPVGSILLGAVFVGAVIGAAIGYLLPKLRHSVINFLEERGFNQKESQKSGAQLLITVGLFVGLGVASVFTGIAALTIALPMLALVVAYVACPAIQHFCQKFATKIKGFFSSEKAKHTETKETGAQTRIDDHNLDVCGLKTNNAGLPLVSPKQQEELEPAKGRPSSGLGANAHAVFPGLIDPVQGNPASQSHYPKMYPTL